MFNSDTDDVKSAIGFFLTLILVACAAPRALAADSASQFGVIWGLSVPDADNTNTFHLMGVKGAAYLVPSFSIGGYFFTSDHAGELSDTQKFNYGLIGIEPSFHMPQSNGDTFISVRIGMTKLNKNVTPSVDGTFSPYHYGVVTGYDYFIGSAVAIGFEGSYLHVLPGRTNIGGTDYNQDSFNLINFLITLQLRL